MSGNLWMFSDMLDDEDIEMQNPLPHHGLAIIPNIRWAGYRCGKSVVIDWQKRIVRIIDRLCQTNLLNVP